ncbi:hypothetical protein ACWT_5105 [Actinoplanes sp. SE50]|nr:hypothetical protein ACWT_5105 [Actinoplanes sp. SE50]SLM01930.1 hypothetical protein ACSP50_5168 [Actinoplanes sp. SE50/110]
MPGVRRSRPRHRRHLRWHRRWWPAAVLVIVTAAALPVTGAGYTGTTSTPVNTFTAGTVVVSASAPAGRVFAITNAIPGTVGTTCVITAYTGTAPATVKMYFTSVAGTLGAYLVAQVQSGTGAQTDCSDFGSSATLYNGSAPATGGPTLGPYLAAHTGWSSGDGAWAVSGPATRAWRFDLLLPNTAGDAAAGLGLTFTATWEAQT